MKKYFRFIFLLPIIFMIVISACDKIDPPYKDSQSEIPDTLKVRKFLLEEFTGHTCPNCPQGAIVAQQLKSYYGERLILISIHAGDFAEPGIGEFAPDYRCSTGNDIFNFFTPLGFPAGMVSRTGWSSSQNNTVIDKDAWGSKIESLKSLLPQISIEITNSFDTITRTVYSSIQCDALQNLTGTYKISAYLTEDSLISGQITDDVINYPGGIIHNYVHRHILRGAMNNTWGDTLTSGNTFLGTQILKDFNMTLNAAWNENHCHVVAFIYDVSNYEIMQVEEKRIK